MIRIRGDYAHSWQRELYSKEAYIRVLTELEHMLKDIPIAVKDDLASELATFVKVCVILSGIVYDEETEKTEKSSELFGDAYKNVACRNLEGGILDKTCVCEGYAEILRNALALKGIEALYIAGFNPIKKAAHAWNQVKIGGHWYNTDLTHSIRTNRIISREKEGYPIGIYLLFSDEEFHYEDYGEERPVGEKKCNTRIVEAIRAYRKAHHIVDSRELEI
jgi:hypothetical protein